MNRRCSPPRFPWDFVALARRVTQCCGLPEGKQSSGERIDFSDFRFVTTMLDRGGVLRGDAFAMTDFFQNLLDSSFTPHGQAYLMRPEIIWLHVISDGLIALAYFSILAGLVYFVRNRSDLPGRGMFLLFGFFLLACGVAHLLEIWTVWHGIFRLTGVVKAVTGVAAFATALMLVKMVPQALALPSPEDLEQARLALESEKAERAHEQRSWSAERGELKRQIEA